MSDTMNSRIFARKWLEHHGLFDKDSDYDGALGEQVMAVVELVASQGHTGASADRLYTILQQIYQEYATDDSPIWQAYWESDEGKALKAQFLQGVKE